MITDRSGGFNDGSVDF